MHNHIVCTCVASPHCGWACAFSGFQPHQMSLRILHICAFSPQSRLSCVSSKFLLDQMTSHILSKCDFAPLWVRRCCFRVSARLNDLLHWTQLYPPLWISMFIFKSSSRSNDFSHLEPVFFLLEVNIWVTILLGSEITCSEIILQWIWKNQHSTVWLTEQTCGSAHILWFFSLLLFLSSNCFVEFIHCNAFCCIYCLNVFFLAPKFLALVFGGAYNSRCSLQEQEGWPNLLPGAGVATALRIGKRWEKDSPIL